MATVKKGGYIVASALVVIVSAFVASHFGLFKKENLDKLVPGGNNSTTTAEVDEDAKTFWIGVVTFPGYAGAQMMNEGFAPNIESYFYKEYGFQVGFKILNDFNASREAWKSGAVDLLWVTADAYTTEADGLKEFHPKFLWQVDWSRGADAIVVRKNINTVADLKGKKIAFATMTPSNSFLINLLNSSNLTYNDIEVVQVPDAIAAADAFKSGNVDAAIVWSPDDEACVTAVQGSKVLVSTATATNIIADGFIAKQEVLDKYQKELIQLYEGWMKGNALINSSDEYRVKAAKILQAGYEVDYDFCYGGLGKVRLVTHGDNLNFFGINNSFTGVTGDKLYTKMVKEYKKVGLIPQNVNTYWRDASTLKIVSNANLSGADQQAEAAAEFHAPTQEDYKKVEISNKSITVNFDVGSSVLDDNAKTIIDLSFADAIKEFGNALIKIEGNTDNTGDAGRNKELSKKRAQAVADYLTSEYNVNSNRFLIVGNGSDNPVNPSADNNSKAARDKNRRTDFKLVAN